MPADKDEEIFEIVDDHNQVIGREQRGNCHKKGYCHRAVYCLVFNTQGHLLLQQRADRKSIGPGEWDLSIAEHLQPGESYPEAVVRGLKEELGISTDLAHLEGPLSPCHQRVLDVPGLIRDVEFVATYRLNGWDGQVALDADEVQDWKWAHLSSIYTDVTHHPDKYTAWLKAELGLLKNTLLLNGTEREAETSELTELSQI